MNIERESLADATRRVREALAVQNPPAAVHRVLRAAFVAAAPQPIVVASPRAGIRALAPSGRGWWLAAACASLLIASTVLLLLASPAERSPRALATDAEPAFVPVAPAEHWPVAGPQGSATAWLVAAEIPRERLAAWGLPFDPARAGEAVRAELLMRPSGEVLAVRVVHAAAGR